MITLIQCDDFLPNAGDVRDKAISGEFRTNDGPDGAKYTGTQMIEVPELVNRIGEVLGRKIVSRLSGFRLNLKGELPHSWVHSDDICSRYASVLYLNTPAQCYGGTAFWKHRGLKIDSLPTPERLAECKIEADGFYQAMTRDWKNLDCWEQVGFVGMKFNRFITYPTSMFHSRYPFEGYGSGPADGRLVWVCFYDFA